MASDPDGAAGRRATTLFLSYARADRTRAERLSEVLADAGYTVWWDALIEGGAEFAASIREALETADVVVVLWSEQSVESDWVRDEAALGRDRHRLIPLTLDGTLPPLGFRQYQSIDLSRWKGKSNSAEVAAIERAVALALGRKPAPLPQTKRLSRRSLIIAGSSAGAILAGGGAWLAWQEGLIGPSEHADLSIAVLPFRNLSGDEEQEYLSDGLTEEIRAALSRIAALQVLAATSSDAARQMGKDAVSIARKLKVTYLLDGSVRRAGDVVRVSVDLTDGETGFSQWSQSVDRRLTDLFAFQSEIAATIANAMSIRVATSEPAPGGTRNARAYESYLRGRRLYNLAKDEESDRQARADFELAIGADPNFALAHAALSRVLASLAASNADASELKPLYDAAIAEARRSIELSPNLAEGNLALAYALFAGRLDVKGARPYYDKAYRYGRGNADIVLLYALYAVRALRFDEARTAIDRALALDPLNPRTHRAAGTIAYASRRYADAVKQYRRALELNPQLSNAHALMGDALLELGRTAEARTAYAAEPQAMFRLRGQAVLEHRLGNRTAAQRAYDQLVSEVGDAGLYQQAEVMAQWGRPTDALAKLKRAREVGDSGLSLIATDPLLDPIANNADFIHFVNDLGFG